ncbi:CubicO group peptidase, beta-lactamase class C family [Pedobacter sp. ok626]|uniref:serine hydrolase domain-containing protein n=1 Tax=Pedobacter sp. ok626 TaxID=1761882 RepID=UPI0008896F34|nr:serine hydrolase [Pedobacter sp. ok626]SDJ28286.1 CubicO group peptidase, beta-lactamase class C family [Pedobacter sp. ok626]
MNKLIIGLLILCSFNACAQDSKQNEQQLQISNAIKNNTVLLNNQEATVPLLKLDKRTIASVSLGFNYQTIFDSLMNKYAKITSFSSAQYLGDATLDNLEDDLKYFNTVIISIPSNEATNARNINFISSIAKSKQVIVTLFGDAGSIQLFNSFNSPIIWTDQNTPISATVIPQAIFGGIGLNKKLATTLSPKYSVGTGFSTNSIRLKYTVPEDAGVHTNNLKEIDDIAKEAIEAHATPGIVVLVAKDGKVIFNKAYGNHTYSNENPDKLTDIFDLASLTKTTATTPTIMRLVEQKKLNLDTNIGAYIPRARTSPMNNIKIREVMLHQAGFIPYIPFHNAIQPSDYSRDSSAAYPTKVADNYYVRKNYFKDVMWPKMLNSPIKTRGTYVYSDISMYVMKEIAERITGIPLDQYVQDNFYKPLGMQTAGFLPRNRFSRDQIVPTEQDTYFRKTLLQGYVHDQGAALAGGVSGHAGLFASANDVAIIYQMLLNKGTYGGEQYFTPQIVDMFTAKQSNVSRRGLGFDRWDPDLTKKYPSETASPQTYGHTGYTGTCVWVDPARGLVYIFLSNRVYPSVTDKLSTLKIRGRIQDVINRAIDQK